VKSEENRGEGDISMVYEMSRESSWLLLRMNMRWLSGIGVCWLFRYLEWGLGLLDLGLVERWVFVCSLMDGGWSQAFLDDLRMVENPALERRDKLQVVQRIWRCWGVDGRRPH
jgi:hypothetical protein